MPRNLASALFRSASWLARWSLAVMSSDRAVSRSWRFFRSALVVLAHGRDDLRGLVVAACAAGPVAGRARVRLLLTACPATVPGAVVRSSAAAVPPSCPSPPSPLPSPDPIGPGVVMLCRFTSGIDVDDLEQHLAN